MATIFHAIDVTISDQVATVVVHGPNNQGATGQISHLHWELGQAFGELRANHDVRVIVLTGEDDTFLTVRPPDSYRSADGRRARVDPEYIWQSFTGTTIMHETMAQIEKPIVAKVNGDAVGFGSTLMFACDLIVAREDAVIVDTHMGMGERSDVGPADFALVPGDGGTALIPLFMGPALAKEYLLLSRPFTAADMARLGIINYAVPANELDATVDELVARLLKRSAYALAWGKRLANRPVIEQLSKSLDPGLAYEIVNFLQWDQMDGGDTKSFISKH